MKVRTLVIAGAATFALVVPATQAATKPVGVHAKTTKHVAVHHAAKGKTVKVAAKPTTAKVVKVTLPATLPQQDPNAVDCTYMICIDLAGSDATAAPADGSTADDSTAQAAPVPTCTLESYMC